MNQNDNPIVGKESFPDNLASDKVKESKDYGLKVAHAIQYQWFKREGSNGCQYYDRLNDFYLRRLYYHGEQPISKYQDRMKVNGDLSLLNLDWTPPSVLQKFVDRVVNGMSDRMLEPKAFAYDAPASGMRTLYQKTIEEDMIAKDFLNQTKNDFGIDAFNVPPDELPENDDELQLHMQLKYKPAIEIAEEIALSNVLEMNDFDETRKMYLTDQVVLGMGVVKHEYVKGQGIRVKYVDPEYVIHSFTEDPYFNDVFYWGEIKTIPTTELRKINPDLTDADIEKIANAGLNWSNQYRINMPYINDVFSKDTVTVMYFRYRTTKNFVYKRKFLSNNGERIIKKDDSFNPPEDNGLFEKVSKTEEVWYNGCLVLGTDYLLKWELEANMVRPESEFQKSHPIYIAHAPGLYKGTIDSIVKRSIQFVDQIALTHLKIQQVAQKIVPDGIYIDADGLNEIDLGNGAVYNPQAALDLYFSTGSVIGRSYTADGEYNHGKVPIQELSHNSGQNKIGTLINMYNYYLNMIRDVTGLNESVDASSLDPDSLVGVQKLAATNSNIATRHIFDSAKFMTERLCECLSIRISDVLEYAPEREEFAQQIGKYNVAILDEIKSLYLHSFGIYLEVSPDEEEKAALERDIQLAISRDQIGLEDSIDIRSVRNIKLANELLKFKKRVKAKHDQEQKLVEMEYQNQNNIDSANAAAAAKQQQIQAEAQAKMQVNNSLIEGEMRKLQFEAELKKELMDKEFNFNMQLKGIEANSLKERDQYKEDEKNKRTKIQATQQSKMISQRNQDSPPIDFESTEDTLDGFGLEQFNVS